MKIDKSPKVSPTPKQGTIPPVDEYSRVDFPDAMRAIIDNGAKVTKLEWDNPEIVVWLESTLKIRLADGSIHDLIISDGDMIGEDWVIV